MKLEILASETFMCDNKQFQQQNVTAYLQWELNLEYFADIMLSRREESDANIGNFVCDRTPIQKTAAQLKNCCMTNN